MEMGHDEARHQQRHWQATHERWLDRRHRKQEAPDYQDVWQAQQCGACTFWVPLAGSWGLDWGACSNPRSPLDGRVQFEHDGCAEFRPGSEWASPEEPGLHLR